MNYLEIVTNVFKAIWSLKNVRYNLIFTGQDYSQVESEDISNTLTDAESKILKEAGVELSKEELAFHGDLKKNNAIRNTGKKSKALKEQRDELSKQKTLDGAIDKTQASVTQSEAFLNSIKNLEIDTETKLFGKWRVGRYIGWITEPMNIVFSPTFGRVAALVASFTVMLTPLGPAVGGVCLAISLLSLAYDVYRNTNNYRKLNAMREERVLLDEIKKVSGELGTKLPPDLQTSTEVGMKRKNPDLLKATSYVMRGAFANMAITTGLAVATLSPYSVMASMFMMITGYSNTTAMYYQYNKRVAYLHNANALTKAELGLEKDDDLADRLMKLRCYKAATERETEPEKIASAYDDNLKKAQVCEKLTPRLSFMGDVWKVLKHGLSWKRANNMFTPSFMQEKVVAFHSEEAFAKRIGLKLEGVAKERSQEQIVEVKVEKQPEKPITSKLLKEGRKALKPTQKPTQKPITPGAILEARNNSDGPSPGRPH
ncbi:MAG: hypothetical protein LW825_02260 [Candidatus Jidaibacter sp.]|jgi:hypothetical protein|nr:hypothetical protein [Candidatus Jidaibacter sp.]